MIASNLVPFSADGSQVASILATRGFSPLMRKPCAPIAFTCSALASSAVTLATDDRAAANKPPMAPQPTMRIFADMDPRSRRNSIATREVWPVSCQRAAGTTGARSCIRRHGRACPGHPRLCCQAVKTWMPATSAGMMGNAIPFDPRRHSAVARQNYRNRSRNPLKGEEPARLAWLSCVRLRFCRALRGRRPVRQRHYFMASVRSVIKLNRQVGLPAERTEPLTILTDKSTKFPARQLDIDQGQYGITPGASLNQLIDVVCLSCLFQQWKACACFLGDFADKICAGLLRIF